MTIRLVSYVIHHFMFYFVCHCVICNVRIYLFKVVHLFPDISCPLNGDLTSRPPPTEPGERGTSAGRITLESRPSAVRAARPPPPLLPRAGTDPGRGRDPSPPPPTGSVGIGVRRRELVSQGDEEDMDEADRVTRLEVSGLGYTIYMWAMWVTMNM